MERTLPSIDFSNWKWNIERQTLNVKMECKAVRTLLSLIIPFKELQTRCLKFLPVLFLPMELLRLEL